MQKKKSEKKSAKKSDKIKRVSTQFRFADAQHYDLVSRAAERFKLSMNAWIVQATVRQARLDLGELDLK
jgi:predicted HicB family RNase H-like nuclease